MNLRMGCSTSSYRLERIVNSREGVLSADRGILHLRTKGHCVNKRFPLIWVLQEVGLDHGWYTQMYMRGLPDLSLFLWAKDGGPNMTYVPMPSGNDKPPGFA